MRKEMFALLVFLMTLGFASASCDIRVSLLNQDTYPAVPGEYVKVVLQVTGSETTDCRRFYIDAAPEYPFSIESQDTKTIVFGGNYLSGYSSYVLKAYKLIVDENALDGDQKLKIKYGFEGSDGSKGDLTKEFDINVQDTRTDFDVSLQDYDSATNTLTFGIINIGKYDVDSLTLEIPEQKYIKMKGGNPVIIGSLNSNDDTTANVVAVPKAGDITVKLNYNDQNDVRRSVEEVIYLPQSLIENGAAAKQPRGTYFYLFWLFVASLVFYAIYRYYKNKKEKSNKLALLKR